MKSLFQQKLKAFFFISFLSIVILSCDSGGKEEPIKISPDAESISTYLRGLTFNSDELLNVQPISGSIFRENVGSPSSSTTPGNGTYTECKTQKVNLRSNFEEIAILQPTNGVIYPGALVVADEATLGGIPTPVTIDRAPLKLRLDLPGIGENGNIEVENASNTSVQSSVDEALEWWNANAKPDGYTIASNSSYSAATSYTAKQLSIDVGLNVEWAKGDARAQFNYTSNESQRVAMMVFKQRFYTISMDAPGSPGDVFGPNATITDVESRFGSNGPPAYVHSVSYGRIIMFRMVTTESATDGELSGALNYAAGVTNVSGSTEIKYKQILEKSSITVVTMGGNAEAASSAVTARSFADLEPILQGENAVYSRNNPGVPIAYSLKYLKDNTSAKLGYTTDYNVKTCEEGVYPARDVSLNNKNGFLGVNMRFTITYKKLSGGNSYNHTINSGTISTNTKNIKSIPAGAYDIRITIEFQDGFKWKFLSDYTYSRPTAACFQSEQSFAKVTVKKISC